MIIISAGVVMNLIFAVIFAAIAYSQGVSYMPCLVGGTAPGDPAWVGGMNAGDKILQIGRHGRPDEQLRFDKDLMIDVTLNGAKHPLDLLVRRAGQEEPEWLSLTPTDRLADFDRPATLGVRPRRDDDRGVRSRTKRRNRSRTPATASCRRATKSSPWTACRCPATRRPGASSSTNWNASWPRG